MASTLNLATLTKELKQAGDKRQALHLQRFFKTGPGQYGAGDIFLGVKVPVQRQVASRYGHLSLADIEKLLASPYHEIRLAGILILVRQYEKATSQDDRQKIVNFYLSHTAGINNWDLVDLSAYKVVGDFLVRQEELRKPGSKKSAIPPVLAKLSRSRNLWDRRIAMVSSFAFIKSGQEDVAFALALQLKDDKHDLMHKAVGWMLREAGKRTSQDRLRSFLKAHGRELPRVALRYAIERFSPAERKRFLAM